MDNKGSLFRVELEFRIPEGHKDRQFWEKSGIGRVLAVTADEEERRSIQTLMRDTGVPVDAASGGEEALELARRQGSGESGFQAVLLDWEMPDREAVRTAQALRQVLPETALMLFMADLDAEGTGEAMELTGAGLLTKPFFVSALKEKILEMRAGGHQQEPAAPAGDSALEGLRFLAAEDNEINAEILAELLELEGASCEIVGNGQLAVERFERSAQGEFDAILMDVQMPVMNGYDATRSIRSLPRDGAEAIPIIAMTANAFAEDEKAALESGMNAHVPKPIDIELLKRVIRTCTARKE